MVRTKTTTRIQRLTATIGEGCPACRDWPHCWILGEHDPEPPRVCERCGLQFDGTMRIRLIGANPDAV